MSQETPVHEWQSVSRWLWLPVGIAAFGTVLLIVDLQILQIRGGKLDTYRVLTVVLAGLLGVIAVLSAGAVRWASAALGSASAELWDARERLSDLIENAADMMVIVAPDGRYLDANRVARETLGYNLDELRGMTYLDVICPDYLAAANERLGARARGDEIPANGESVIVTRDGRHLWTESRGHPIHDEQGRLVALQCTVRDITERKQFEAQLRDSNARLEGALVHANELAARLEEMAKTDLLTGLLNRRAIIEHAEAEMARSSRDGAPLSIAMIDVDHFKGLNDSHGHIAGDRVLQKVARLLSRSTRRYDWLGRWGGEEFLLVLPGAPVTRAVELAERLREIVASEMPEPAFGSVTISIGVAQAPAGATLRLDDLVQKADESLYEAKQAGRNCVRGYRATGAPA